MKKLLIATALAVLMGCGKSQQSTPTTEKTNVESVAEVPAKQSTPTKPSTVDPETEARKLYVQAAMLIKSAFEDEDFFSSYKKRRQAVDTLESIPKQYPSSSFALKVLEGDFKMQSRTITEIKQSLEAPKNISLHDAVKMPLVHKIEVVKQHLAAGTNVNSKDLNPERDGESPLHHAVFHTNEEIIEMLFNYNADVNFKSEGGRTPLDVVLHPARHTPKNSQIAEILRNKGGESGAKDSIYVAVIVGNIEAVKKHITAGADVETAPKGNTLRTDDYIFETKGRTLLSLAASDAEYKEYREIAQELILGGANVNAVLEMNRMRFEGPNTKTYSTPLDTATPSSKALSKNESDFINLLRKHGGKTAEELGYKNDYGF